MSDGIAAATQASALSRQGLERLRAGEHEPAVELLQQALFENGEDALSLLGLGIALQGLRRHEEALAALERARALLPQAVLPPLHMSASELALGRPEAALRSAEAAHERAPQLAQSHVALGQARLALGDAAAAERAFAAALKMQPNWTDAWVLAGAARFRQGALESAEAAFREALRLSPGHALARQNIEELERRRAAAFSVWTPSDAKAALGVAADYLSRKPAFGRLPFGEWTQVLYYQVARGHYLFAVDANQKVQGFLGWALTSEDLAEKWVNGRSGLRDDECRAGDCVIINAFAAESDGASRFIVNLMREKFVGKRALFYKRHYRDGRTRPMRLSVNEFVARHLARSSPQGGR